MTKRYTLTNKILRDGEVYFILKIQRERWIIVRGSEIFCGLARCYQFKPAENIGNTAIKTYLSKNKAEISFVSSWRGGAQMLESGEVKAVKVIETIELEER